MYQIRRENSVHRVGLTSDLSLGLSSDVLNLIIINLNLCSCLRGTRGWNTWYEPGWCPTSNRDPSETPNIFLKNGATRMVHLWLNFHLDMIPDLFFWRQSETIGIFDRLLCIHVSFIIRTIPKWFSMNIETWRKTISQVLSLTSHLWPLILQFKIN